MAPPLTDHTRSFWTGGATGELLIARCGSCQHYSHPPQPLCPRCHSADVTPQPVSGAGRVRSYTVSTYQWVSTMPPPYLVVEVELVEQADLVVLSNLVDIDPAEVTIGLPVEVRFVPTGEAFVPVFVASES